MSWWGQFNDDNLNAYIIKAMDKNQDLKMATLTIDEYYQNVIAQRAGELPTVSAGFLPGYGKFIGPSAGGFGLPIIANYELDIWGKIIIRQLRSENSMKLLFWMSRLRISQLLLL